MATNTAFNTKIGEVEKKILVMLNILPPMNLRKFLKETFDERLRHTVFGTKNEEKTGKLQTYDSSLFIGQSYFENDG